MGGGAFYDTVTVYVVAPELRALRFTELSRRDDRERASVRVLSVQLHTSYLGGYRPLMGGGVFYDTVTVYVLTPG